MNDPQMLGHAIMLMGLVIYLKNRSNLLVVAFLCCLGIFTKHILLPVPIAISVDIILRSRKEFLKWIMECFVISSGLLIFTLMFLGHEFIYQLIAPRGFDINELIIWKDRVGIPLVTSILLTIPGLYHIINNDKTIPMYLLFSIVFGIYTLGGIGTDINSLFNLFISLSIMSGMSLFFLFKKFSAFDRKTLLISISCTNTIKFSHYKTISSFISSKLHILSIQ
jgi:hypothetical protein